MVPSLAMDSRLHDAVSDGDLAIVTTLLEDGASPLAVRDSGESVLRAAHRHREGEPHGAEVFQLIRRAAREAIEKVADRVTGLGSQDAPGGKGAEALRRSVDGELDVLLAECDVKVAARALAELVQAPRREADVAARPVADAARLAFVYRKESSAWAVLPLRFASDSPWNVENVHELAARGDGIAPLARALAQAAGCRVAHVEADALTMYAPDGRIETPSRLEDGWLPEEADPPGGEDAARRREQIRRVDHTLDELDVDLPAMRVETNGYDVQLVLRGVEPETVERVDLVVLQELGDAPALRALEPAPTTPAFVGPGGQPALAHAPPPVVRPAEPAKSEAPPLEREPPPLVSEPPARPSANAPPPIVTEPPMENELPPPAEPPPPVGKPEPPRVAPPPKSESD